MRVAGVTGTWDRPILAGPCENGELEGRVFLAREHILLKKLKKIFFVQILKVAFHLQLLHNIGYIPHVVQYILEPILYTTVCTSHSPILLLPLPPVTTSLFSISVSLLLICYIH